MTPYSRRSVLGAAAGAAVLGSAGWLGYRALAGAGKPGGTVPDAPVGDERLDRRRSSARGRSDFLAARLHD